MKHTKKLILLIICLALAGCGVRPPEKTADGRPWNPDWVTIGSVMGVSLPEEWVMQRSEDVLAAEGTFYTVWSKGEAHTEINAEGTEITAYDAQIHVIAMKAESSAQAQELTGQWQQLAEERYTMTEAVTEDYAGQTYTVTTYPIVPASQGASASAVRGDWAVRIDVITMDSFEQSPSEVLTEFLNNCHYAA